MHRIGLESGNVVGIGVATGQTKHTLPEQILERVHHLARLPVIAESLGHGGRETELVVDGLQQNGATVGGHLGLVELDVEGLGDEGWKQNRLSARIRHAKTSWFGPNRLGKRILANREVFVFKLHA